MKAMRALLSIVILAAAAGAIYVMAWRPYRCACIAKRLDERTASLWRNRTIEPPMRETREHLAELAPCLKSTPWNIRLHAVAGTNYLLRHDYENAAASYRRALEWDRRPELEFSLGAALLNLGRREEAIEHIWTATLVQSRFSRDLPTDVQYEIQVRLNELEKRVKARQGK